MDLEKIVKLISKIKPYNRPNYDEKEYRPAIRFIYWYFGNLLKEIIYDNIERVEGVGDLTNALKHNSEYLHNLEQEECLDFQKIMRTLPSPIFELLKTTAEVYDKRFEEYLGDNYSAINKLKEIEDICEPESAMKKAKEFLKSFRIIHE